MDGDAETQRLLQHQEVGPRRGGGDHDVGAQVFQQPAEPGAHHVHLAWGEPARPPGVLRVDAVPGVDDEHVALPR